MGFDGSTSTSSEAAVRAYSDALLAAVNTAQDAVYRQFITRAASLAETQATSTRTMGPGGTAALTTTSPASAASLFYWDPADYAQSGRTTKLSLQVALLTNATSHGTQTFTVHLYPVTAIAGAADAYTLTLGSSQANCAFVNPSTSTIAVSTAADITIPSAGLYGLFLHNSATVATDATATALASLRMRYI